MKSRHSLRLFEHEGRVVIFGLAICIAYAAIRIIRCSIVMDSMEIYDRLSRIMFLEGYIYDDPGLGFFDNALFAINVYIPCILISSLMEDRYECEKAYYFSRYGMKGYYLGNVFLGTVLMLGYECIQLGICFAYAFIFNDPYPHAKSTGEMLLFILLHFLCMIFHMLVTWIIWLFIKGYLRFLIPVILILGELIIASVMAGRRLMWCPVSIISFDGWGSGNNAVFILWLIILILAAGSVTAGRKYIEDIL